MKMFIYTKLILLIFMIAIQSVQIGYTNPQEQDSSFSIMQWSSDSKYLAVYNSELGTCLYDGKLFIPHWQIPNTDDNILWDLEFIENENVFLTANELGQIHFWDIEQERIIDVLDAHEGRISSIDLNLDETLLASSGFDDGYARIWDLDTKTLVSEYTFSKDKILAVRKILFYPDQNKIATLITDGVVSWDIENADSLPEGFSGPPRLITFTNLVFSLDGTILAAPTWAPFVAFWNLPTHESTKVRLKSVDDISIDVAFSPDGQLFAILTANGIELYQIEINDEVGVEYLTEIPLNTADKNVYAQRIVFSPDSKYLATTGKGITQIWNIETGEIEVILDDCTVEN